uniref:Reverse transcriptase domain-containing protein n=1 Tax=Cannabis sativa TaxID=3483 RepID=A0A803QR90_CANSA
MLIGDRFGGPCLILGDTNFVLSASECEGSTGRDQFIPFISSLVESRGLINMPIHDDKKTSDNHRSSMNHVKYALDKGLVNGAWLNLFTRAIIFSYQTSNSDRRPPCLFSGSLVAKYKRCFQFEEGWMRDLRSKLVVAYAWNSVAHPWAPARVFKKIGATQVALLHWHRSQFGKVDSVIKDLEEKLNNLQSLPAGARDWNFECDVKRSLYEALERKALGRRNVIESILNKDNLWITNRDLIGREFIGYFQEALLICPTHEEIQSTLFAMGNHKALGPDDFFTTGKMHKGVNAMNIVLIPKVQNPKRTNQFRPISLCNVTYKVISKNIAKRIKLILPSLIFPTQAAFVPGRNIQDNNAELEIYRPYAFLLWNSSEILQLGLSMNHYHIPQHLSQWRASWHDFALLWTGTRQKDADFNFILDNLTYKLQGWKAKTLSKAAKASLIELVGLSLPLYAMQTTKLSNRMVNKIDGMVRDFRWGFRKRILEAKYLKGKDFLNCTYKDSDSLFWKNVVIAKSILRKGACKVVADCRHTSIWGDPWIPHIKDFIPRPKGPLVSEISTFVDLFYISGGWDIHKLNNLFDQETVSVILKGGPPSGQGFHKWIWNLESYGCFSCKSAYISQRNLGNTFSCPVRWPFMFRGLLLGAFNLFVISVFACETKSNSFGTLNIRAFLLMRFSFMLRSLLTQFGDCAMKRSTCIYFPYPCFLPKGGLVSSPQDWIKLNCDVTVGFESMCAAVVARNHLGQVIWIQTSRDSTSSGTLCSAFPLSLLRAEFTRGEGETKLLSSWRPSLSVMLESSPRGAPHSSSSRLQGKLHTGRGAPCTKGSSTYLGELHTTREAPPTKGSSTYQGELYALALPCIQGDLHAPTGAPHSSEHPPQLKPAASDSHVSGLLIQIEARKKILRLEMFKPGFTDKIEPMQLILYGWYAKSVEWHTQRQSPSLTLSSQKPLSGKQDLNYVCWEGDSMSSTNSTPRDEHEKSLSRDKSSTDQVRQLVPTHHEGISLREAPHSLRKRLHPRGLMLGGTSPMVPHQVQGKQKAYPSALVEFDEDSLLSREIQMEALPPNSKESHMTLDEKVSKKAGCDNIMPVTSVTNVKQEDKKVCKATSRASTPELPK